MALYSYNKEICPALQSLSELGRSECVVLCAEPGMGKTTCLSKAVLAWLRRGDSAQYKDFAGCSAANVATELRKIRRAGAQKGTSETLQAQSKRRLIACDNVVAGDESDVDRTVSVITKCLEDGLSVAIATTPENEMLVDQIATCSCYWSCDLRLPRPLPRGEALTYDLYAHGIPCLIDALSKTQVDDMDAIATDASYQEPYVNMVATCVRTGMMMEEKQLRITMLLLGAGTKKDIVDVLGDIDEDLWLLLVRDSPFLGADAASGTFACVGSHSFDCLYLAYASLVAITYEMPWLVASVSRALVRRGDYARAAVVGSLCSDVEQKCPVLLESGPQMIDAGELTVVADAVQEALEQGLTHALGYVESTCVLSAMAEGFKGHKVTNANELEATSPRGLYARAVLWCAGMRRGVGLVGEPPFAGKALKAVQGAGIEPLVAHGMVMRYISEGRLDKAYDLMLGMSQRLEEGRASAAVAQMDYMLCSLLNGHVPSELDFDTMERHKFFLERSGFTSMIAAYDAIVASCKILVGRLSYDEPLDAHIQRAERAGYAFVRGLLLVVAGVSDLRIGALTRSHVRLQQALTTFTSLGLSTVVAQTHLLDIVLRAELGEHILKPEIQSCRGFSEHLDKVVTIVAAALSRRERKRRVGSGRWGALKCPQNALWLVNVLMNDCGGMSRRIRAVMPMAWKDSVIRVTADIDEYFCAASMGPMRNQARRGEPGIYGENKKAKTDAPLVSISLLGRFEVSVGGLPMSLTRLERRRSKALLALLASVPGHKAKRFVIMESIWPSHDYGSANQCLYAATSVIRKQIGALLETEQDAPLVLTNKTEGTVSLNMEAFSIDVDEFEARARRLVDVEGEDREVVSTCREIEDLYKGDLFISPTDGMGVVGTRSRELCTLFSDAMIAGALAAENLGMKSLACRFARKAHDADDVREDAMRVLAITLCAAGRHAEAERTYEQFVGRVVDLTKRPPSRQLRETVDQLIHGSVRRTGSRKKGGNGDNLADSGTKESLEGQLSLMFEDEEASGSTKNG